MEGRGARGRRARVHLRGGLRLRGGDFGEAPDPAVRALYRRPSRFEALMRHRDCPSHGYPLPPPSPCPRRTGCRRIGRPSALTPYRGSIWTDFTIWMSSARSCADVSAPSAVSTRSIRRFIADGRLKAHRIGAGVRVDPSDVMTFFDASRIVPASDGGEVSVRLSCTCSDVADKRRAASRGLPSRALW